jgi:hypothetical protein
MTNDSSRFLRWCIRSKAPFAPVTSIKERHVKFQINLARQKKRRNEIMPVTWKGHSHNKINFSKKKTPQPLHVNHVP